MFREDVLVCERLQEVAHRLGMPPRLGKLEGRIDWFEESYRSLIAAGQRILPNEVLVPEAR